MQKITPHLWFDKEAKEATEFYVSLFPDSQVKNVRTIKNTPSGDCDIVRFDLAGEPFMAISAGPYFKFNPPISFFVTFESEEEVKKTWDKLIAGGQALMAYDTYPWAKKYGWLQDKYGLSWQLSWSEHHQFPQKITPLLMYTGANAGKTEEALNFYTSIFPNSKINFTAHYEAGEGDKESFIKHAQFNLGDSHFMAMDSSGPHKFTFNEAVSLVVNCADQTELDYYWEKLSAVPEAEQCGWLKDKYGVSWQIVPTALNEMMTTSDQAQLDRVTQAFLKMKKFDIAKLKEAAEGK